MFKIITKIIISVLGVTVISSGSASAAEDGPDFSITFTGATDYIFRGVGQTNNEPGVFVAATVDFNNGFYATVGAENVEFGDSTDVEYDFLAGWIGNFNGFDLHVRAIRYGYISAPSGSDLDTYEFMVGLSHSFDKVTLGVAAHYTPDYFGVDESAIYYEGTASFKIDDKWSTSVGIAKQTIANSEADYATWNIGASYAATDNITLDLRYTDTDVSAGGDLFNNHIIFTVSAGF